jgi:hypothetical protein
MIAFRSNLARAVAVFCLLIGSLACLCLAQAGPSAPAAPDGEGISRLTKAPQDDNPLVRKRAAGAPGRLGPRGKAAVPDLERAVGNADVRAASVTLEALDLGARQLGTLRGKVTLDGPPPQAEIARLNEQLLAAINKSLDRDYCLTAPEDQKTQQVWKVNKNGAVRDVVVWLRPPAGTYFKIDREYLTWPQEVVIDQPFGTYVPHVLVLFPSYFDPRLQRQTPSGQVFVARNSAQINTNVKWAGGARNPGDNKMLAPGTETRIDLAPAYGQPVVFDSILHTWTAAYAWAFDHPYAAVTDAEGRYEIRHVPTGVSLQVVAWHEKAGFLTPGKADGESITLKVGDNVRDFKLRAK